MNFRSKILSGTLPVDELKEIQRLATSTIDVGNKYVNLKFKINLYVFESYFNVIFYNNIYAINDSCMMSFMQQ